MKRILFFCLLMTALVLVFLSGACASVSKKNDPDFLGNYPMQSLGVLHLNIVKRYSDDLIPRDMSFVFDPSSNTVKIHHKLMGENVWIHLKKNDRMLLRQGIEQYLAAFAGKTLTPEGAKEKGSFGKIKIIVNWGLLGGAHEAAPTLRFEYQFITPKRPYFILANTTVQSEDGTNCPSVRIAVSPTQCNDFLQLLDETALLQLVAELKAEYEKFDGNDTDTAVRNAENAPEGSDTPIKQEDISFDEF